VTIISTITIGVQLVLQLYYNIKYYIGYGITINYYNIDIITITILILLLLH